MVVGLDAIAFIGRRVVDAALHTDRRAMHEAPDAVPARRLEQVTGTLDVDASELVARRVLGPISRRNVVDGVEVLEGGFDACRVAKIDDLGIDSVIAQGIYLARRAHERHDAMTFGAQTLAERSARESCAAGDEDVSHVRPRATWHATSRTRSATKGCDCDSLAPRDARASGVRRLRRRTVRLRGRAARRDSFP